MMNSFIGCRKLDDSAKETITMKRILIIGNAGAGKTTFANRLALKMKLPLVHLDKIYWCDNWQHLSREEFDCLLQKELEKPEWIIDGNFNRTISHRMKYCDTIFYFDFHVIRCLWGITKRIIVNYGKTRNDMGGVCIERFDTNKIALYRNVLRFNREHRKNYYDLLNISNNIDVVVFKNRKQVRKYLKNI